MQNLTGKLLIAMPGMGDPRFERSVVFLCEHSDKGAMGLIVNKPAPEVDGGELLQQLGIDAEPGIEIGIHFGGPVEHGRGFVLHSSDYHGHGATVDVTESVGMTSTLDILKDIARGHGPDQAILALGYAGWAPGQLEEELAENGWLTADAGPDVVFHPDANAKWQAALAAAGVDARLLSGQAGHA